MNEVPTAVLRQCVDDYVSCCQPAAFKQAAYYEGQPPDLALKKAARLWIAEGVLHPHLRCVSKAAKAKLQRDLPGRTQDLQRASDFDAIYRIMRDICDQIDGAGELTVYETALHIGFSRCIEPSKVYLHSGALGGAKALWPNRLLKSGDVVDVTEFPEIIQELSAAHIENMLCIYQDDLRLKRFSKSRCAHAGGTCTESPAEGRRRRGC